MENKGSFSFRNYIDSEFRRGYHMEYDRERFASRKEKIYAFFKIPIEVEKLIIFGFFHCADSFLFVITFLPIRFLVALWKFIYNCIFMFLWKKPGQHQFLRNMETIDLIKGFLILFCCIGATYVDTSMYYHMIKTQSAVKLYIFYNMMDIADKLMSSFGQDTLDALFWTATATKSRKRDYFHLMLHFLVGLVYICIHSGIMLFQALVLNVAVNSENRGLLTIFISNNFIEIKGSVFKKYGRNNLLQIACSDVRERFQHGMLIFVVMMLTMKEYSWNPDRLYDILKICLIIFWVEMAIDWLKHAFITRFNEIPIDVYNDYMLLISSDLIMCKKQNAFSDHSDLVARRMGFTPLPMGVIVFRILSQTLKFDNLFSFLLLFVGYLCLLSLRILNSIIILGVASRYIGKVNTSRSNSECEKKDTAWKNAVESYCERVPTPLRSRQRTISKDKLETLLLSTDMKNATNDNSASSLPADDSEGKSADGSNNASCGSELSSSDLDESPNDLLSNSIFDLADVKMPTSESNLLEAELDIHEELMFTEDIIEQVLSHSVQPDTTQSYCEVVLKEYHDQEDVSKSRKQEDISESRQQADVNNSQDQVAINELCSQSNINECREQAAISTSLSKTDISESEVLPILRKGVLVSDDTKETLTPINSTTKHY